MVEATELSNDPAEPIESLIVRLSGATRGDDAYGPQCVLPAGPAAPAGGHVMPLLDLGLWSAEGADAHSFLQGQLTNDIGALKPGSAQWSGYCNPKGRLLANLLLLSAPGDALRLVVPQPQSDALRKRLSMFVLRAKVKLVDQRQSTAMFGLAGPAARDWLTQCGLTASGPMQLTGAAGLTAVRLADLPALPRDPRQAAAPAGIAAQPIERFLLLCAREQVESVWRSLTDRLQPQSSAFWRFLEVAAGEPRLVGAALEQFVPQMINLDALGALSFTKGCFTGQEVVARTQNLGKLKRRMMLAWTDATAPAPAPGDDVLRTGQSEPVGQVVSSAPSGSGSELLLAEVTLEAQQDELRLATGAGLRPVALPYRLPIIDNERIRL